jgi:hypothetical protein
MQCLTGPFLAETMAARASREMAVPLASRASTAASRAASRGISVWLDVLHGGFGNPGWLNGIGLAVEGRAVIRGAAPRGGTLAAQSREITGRPSQMGRGRRIHYRFWCTRIGIGGFSIISGRSLALRPAAVSDRG